MKEIDEEQLRIENERARPYYTDDGLHALEAAICMQAVRDYKKMLITSRFKPMLWYNDTGHSIEVLNKPVDGERVGYLKPSQKGRIVTDIRNGWGRINIGKRRAGWIDTSKLQNPMQECEEFFQEPVFQEMTGLSDLNEIIQKIKNIPDAYFTSLQAK